MPTTAALYRGTTYRVIRYRSPEVDGYCVARIDTGERVSQGFHSRRAARNLATTLDQVSS